MPEGTITPELKTSKNPVIQQKVDERVSKILTKHPNADPEIVNESARSRVAAEIRLNRIRQELQTTKKTSITDTLTGAMNNTGFEQIMQLEGRRTLRTQKPMAIVVLDANNLREINKSGGHSAGDNYLKSIAEVLRRTSRASDILGRRSNSEEESGPNVARWGGDEFGVILEETGVEGAKAWWTRTSDEFNKAGISIGAGLQVLNPEEIIGKTPSEISAIIADKKHEADLALMGVAKQESKSTNQPTLVVYDEIPEDIKQTLPQRVQSMDNQA